MFNRYWREYTWFMQLVQFVLVFFISLTFFSVVALYLAPMLTGVSIEQIQNISESSSPQVRIGFLTFQGIAHLGMFTLSVAMFVYALHPRPLEYLNIKGAGKSDQWLWVGVLALATIPVISGLASLIDMIPLSDSLEKSKETFEAQQNGILNLTTVPEYISAIIVMSILPAVGEELLFRGIMMRFASKKMVGSIFWPILLSSVFFAMIHGNVLGLIPILIAGMVLGYVYYLTGSLVLAMYAHWIVDFTQVSLVYFGRNNEQISKLSETNEMPMGLFAVGLIVFVLAFYMLWKNKTPLPKTWTNDFTTQELEEIEQEKRENY
ncbi:MAG: CPBP family intramembrane metalloprotease [Chitinophagales bacterium]|nr:CPBP family intramembrane metalloprotease [Chitinophagaceae bacterium]MCB9063886.1 CPBP family intramembrane metalloprotease [Chitinophagales bacterium]